MPISKHFTIFLKLPLDYELKHLFTITKNGQTVFICDKSICNMSTVLTNCIGRYTILP